MHKDISYRRKWRPCASQEPDFKFIANINGYDFWIREEISSLEPTVMRRYSLHEHFHGDVLWPPYGGLNCLELYETAFSIYKKSLDPSVSPNEAM